MCCGRFKKTRAVCGLQAGTGKNRGATAPLRQEIVDREIDFLSLPTPVSLIFHYLLPLCLDRLMFQGPSATSYGAIC